MVTVQYNPFIPEVHANPYPMYARLRAEDPVHWSALMEAWVLTRYDDVAAVLTDSRFSADRRQARKRPPRGGGGGRGGGRGGRTGPRERGGGPRRKQKQRRSSTSCWMPSRGTATWTSSATW